MLVSVLSLFWIVFRLDSNIEQSILMYARQCTHYNFCLVRSCSITICVYSYYSNTYVQSGFTNLVQLIGMYWTLHSNYNVHCAVHKTSTFKNNFPKQLGKIKCVWIILIVTTKIYKFSSPSHFFGPTKSRSSITINTHKCTESLVVNQLALTIIILAKVWQMYI